MEVHVARGNEDLGVFTLDEVREKLAAGELLASDLAWMEGQTNWVSLERLPELTALTGVGLAPLPTARSRATVPTLQDQQPSSPTAATPTETSSFARASLITGVTALAAIPLVGNFAAIFPIAFGHMARSRIRKASGKLVGSRMALAGLILGYGNLALIPVLLLTIWIQGSIPNEARDLAFTQEMEVDATKNAQRLAAACIAYAHEHHDAFPPRLEDLPDNQLFDRSMLENPSAGGGYTYFGGSTNDAPKKVLLQSARPSSGGGHIVAFVDGSAETNFKGSPASGSPR